MSEDSREPLSPEQASIYDYLRIAPDGVCWWCRERPAESREHKFKRSDLKRLMGDDEFVGWHDGAGKPMLIRGKAGMDRDRYRVVKFRKSMCAPCNNARSQQFDHAYDIYAAYLAQHSIRSKAGIPFERIYGSNWQRETLNLARYYAKHFGCRIVDAGLQAPTSLRDFMNGATDMPDAVMTLVSTASVQNLNSGLSISGNFATVARDGSRFTGLVLAAYIGSIGVRYEWSESALPDDRRSQFFHFPHPVLNYFQDESAVASGEVDRRGLVRARREARILRRQQRAQERATRATIRRPDTPRNG